MDYFLSWISAGQGVCKKYKRRNKHAGQRGNPKIISEFAKFLAPTANGAYCGRQGGEDDSRGEEEEEREPHGGKSRPPSAHSQSLTTSPETPTRQQIIAIYWLQNCAVLFEVHPPTPVCTKTAFLWMKQIEGLVYWEEET